MKATEVCAVLSKYYSHPEWAILFEVADSTGARHTRFCDAIAMSLWPSRGLHLHAMEIKVNRYDWTKNERDNPEKAEKFYSLCDFFWLVTPEGIVQPGELPATWGHKIITADRKLVLAKEATQNMEAKPISKLFLASLMRSGAKDAEVRAAGLIEHERAKLEEEIAQRVEREMRHKTPSHWSELEKKYNDLLASMGLDPKDFTYHTDMSDVGKAYKILKTAGLGGMYESIKYLHSNLVEQEAKTREAMALFGVETTEGDAMKMRIKRHSKKVTA